MLKDILKEFLDLSSTEVPIWVERTSNNDSIKLKSYLFKSDYCKRIRVCELNIERKFKAESLVIYPNHHCETPIFGTEYLQIGSKKYFGAIDFHPISANEDYMSYVDMFPNSKTNTSKFYDLEKYFSKKLWIKKNSECFYNEYQIMVKCYLHQYTKCLMNSTPKKESFAEHHQKFDDYMSTNDPAFGILKSYFNKEFAEKYVKYFLFYS